MEKIKKFSEFNLDENTPAQQQMVKDIFNLKRSAIQAVEDVDFTNQLFQLLLKYDEGSQELINLQHTIHKLLHQIKQTIQEFEG